MPLQQRLQREITRRSTFLKTEQEYKTLMRNIDRAVSLPLERKSYIHDYTLGEKERGYSMQRDQVNFNNILLILYSTNNSVLFHLYTLCRIIYTLRYNNLHNVLIIIPECETFIIARD